MEAYKDHLSLIEDHLARIELLLRAALVRQRREHAALGGMGPLPSLAEGIVDDPDELESAAFEASADIDNRVAASTISLPLAELIERFDLDAFERDVLLLALAPSIDLRFGAFFDALSGNTRGLDVGLALVVLAPLANEQRSPLRMRHYFQADARLIRNHLISLDRTQLDIGSSFLNLSLRLPGRVLGWLMGEGDLDAALHGFSRLEAPEVSLDQVVLPAGVMESLLMLISGHDEYLSTLKRWNIADRVTYGRGIALLFVGMPGTGKTLTAKAVAHAMGMRLLLVDPRRIVDLKRPVEDNLADIP